MNDNMKTVRYLGNALTDAFSTDMIQYSGYDLTSMSSSFKSDCV